MNKERQMDMLNGGLFGKIITFTVPLMLSGLLQMLYNAADMVVVGNFVGEYALASVGATSSLYE
ncbi:MAG: MATE family efflux transporter, partial [Clostridia bacterium]|nr:MATE family efflux transporter [Clostridia bacterium]